MDEQQVQSSRRWLRGAGVFALLLLVGFGVKFLGGSVGRHAAVMSVEQESIAQQAPGGFLEAQWLMSMEEVRALHPDAVVFAPGNLKLETEAFGRPAFIDFIFTDDLLLIIVVYFKGEKTPETFLNTQARLVEQYGPFSEPVATAEHRLASKKQVGRVTMQHLLYANFGLPIEQVVLYRTK